MEHILGPLPWPREFSGYHGGTGPEGGLRRAGFVWMLLKQSWDSACQSVYSGQAVRVLKGPGTEVLSLARAHTFGFLWHPVPPPPRPDPFGPLCVPIHANKWH